MVVRELFGCIYLLLETTVKRDFGSRRNAKIKVGKRRERGAIICFTFLFVLFVLSDEPLLGVRFCARNRSHAKKPLVTEGISGPNSRQTLFFVHVLHVLCDLDINGKKCTISKILRYVHLPLCDEFVSFVNTKRSSIHLTGQRKA